jgi:hypothetical protein
LRLERAGAASAVELVPALKCAGADPCFAGEGGKWNLVLNVKSKNLPTLIAVQERLHFSLLWPPRSRQLWKVLFARSGSRRLE